MSGRRPAATARRTTSSARSTCASVLNILIFWMFDMRFFVHIILGGIVAFFLGVMILIIVNLNSPFRGDVTVSADPFEAIYASLMKPTAGTK